MSLTLLRLNPQDNPMKEVLFILSPFTDEQTKTEQ